MFDWIIYFGRWFFNGIRNLFHFFSVIWNYDHTLYSKLQISNRLFNFNSLEELIKVLEDDCFTRICTEFGLWDIKIDNQINLDLLKSESLAFQKYIECKKQNLLLLHYYLDLYQKELKAEIDKNYFTWKIP